MLKFIKPQKTTLSFLALFSLGVFVFFGVLSENASAQLVCPNNNIKVKPLGLASVSSEHGNWGEGGLNGDPDGVYYDEVDDGFTSLHDGEGTKIFDHITGNGTSKIYFAVNPLTSIPGGATVDGIIVSHYARQSQGDLDNFVSVAPYLKNASTLQEWQGSFVLLNPPPSGYNIVEHFFTEKSPGVPFAPADISNLRFGITYAGSSDPSALFLPGVSVTQSWLTVCYSTFLASPELNVHPSGTVDFGTVPLGGNSTVIFNVSNIASSGADADGSAGVTSGNPDWACTFNCVYTLPPTGNINVNVTFTAPSAPGSKSGTVTFPCANCLSGGVTVNVTANVLAPGGPQITDLRTNPDPVPAGQQALYVVDAKAPAGFSPGGFLEIRVEKNGTFVRNAVCNPGGTTGQCSIDYSATAVNDSIKYCGRAVDSSGNDTGLVCKTIVIGGACDPAPLTCQVAGNCCNGLGCIDDIDCASGECVGNVCVNPLKPNGATCASNTECQSGFCGGGPPPVCFTPVVVATPGPEIQLLSCDFAADKVTATITPSLKSGTPVYYGWKFGDGQSFPNAPQSSPPAAVPGPPDPVTHKYAYPGKYTIQLTAIDGSGKFDQKTIVCDSLTSSVTNTPSPFSNNNLLSPITVTNIPDLLNMLITFILFLATPILILLIIYAGVMLMITGSDPQQRLTAMRLLQYAIIGYAVILLAKVILGVITGVLF